MNLKTAMISLFLLSWSYSVHAAFVSPFPSTVNGIDIPNTHIVAKSVNGKALILRGMEPRTPLDFEQLSTYPNPGGVGIRHILTFKYFSGKDASARRLRRETHFANVELGGFPVERTHHIPFKWKGLSNFQVPCKQTIQALTLLKAVLESDTSIFFHCTLGEERTGYLSALLSMLLSRESGRDLSTYSAFMNNMCKRGYGSGNPGKAKRAPQIVEATRKELTPLYMKMAYKINSGALSWDNLDEKQCATDPVVDYDLQKYRCPMQEIPDKV